MSSLRRMGLALALAATASFAHATASRADDETAPTSEPTTEAPWYTGGNLHKASARQWREATVENQLATASDWVLTSTQLKAKVAASGDMSLVLPSADKLRQCINLAVYRNKRLYDGVPAADIAMTCMIQLRI